MPLLEDRSRPIFWNILLAKNIRHLTKSKKKIVSFNLSRALFLLSFTHDDLARQALFWISVEENSSWFLVNNISSKLQIIISPSNTAVQHFYGKMDMLFLWNLSFWFKVKIQIYFWCSIMLSDNNDMFLMMVCYSKHDIWTYPSPGVCSTRFRKRPRFQKLFG